MSTRSEYLVAANRTAQLQKAPVDNGEYVTLASTVEADCMQVTDQTAVATPEMQTRNQLAVSREAQIAVAILAIVHLVMTCVILGTY